MATGSAAAWPDEAPVKETPTASSPLQLQREAKASRDALRPTLDLSTAPAPKAKSKPVPKHLKKQAPIPKPAPAKTRTSVAPAPETPPKATGSKYTSTDLNVWTAPGQGVLLTVLAPGAKVAVTGEVDGRWAEIVRDGKSRWVKAEYLTATDPTEPVKAPEPIEPIKKVVGGISAEECASGSEVEDGLEDDAVRVHRAVCDLFPSVDSYGGVRSGDSGEHGEGRALDIMVTGATGDEIAAYVRANAEKLGVSEVIWDQQIWTVQRDGEGWRDMEDRGSVTANHVDHVHVTVYGDEGTS